MWVGLKDGREIKGVLAGKDEATVFLQSLDRAVPLEQIESVFVEASTEGPE
jgi:hypothetical protein